MEPHDVLMDVTGSLTTPSPAPENQPLSVNTADVGQSAGPDNLQNRGPTANSPGPFPVLAVHCRLLPQIIPQPSTKVL